MIITIKQIISCGTTAKGIPIIMGLGNDEKVYHWNYKVTKWEIFSE